MPHLSPMLWLLVPSLFMITLFTLMTHLWWAQYPSYKMNSSTATLPLTAWMWN